jgi:hypothetical protein
MFKKIFKKNDANINNKENENNSKTEIKNNILVQELNEIMADQEEIKKTIINNNKFYMELELTIPESLTQVPYPIKFLLK